MRASDIREREKTEIRNRAVRQFGLAKAQVLYGPWVDRRLWADLGFICAWDQASHDIACSYREFKEFSDDCSIQELVGIHTGSSAEP